MRAALGQTSSMSTMPASRPNDPLRGAAGLVLTAEAVEPAGPVLKDFVFVANVSYLQPKGWPADKLQPGGLTAVGVEIPDRADFLRQVIKPALGKPIAVAMVNQLKATIDDWFRRHGQPFITVTIPPQNVSSGVVQIVIATFRVGTVTVSGNVWFSSSLIESESGLRQGLPLELDDLQADRVWLNQNPFRHVDIVLEPSPKPDVSNVVLRTKDEFPLRVYVGFDNEDVGSLGRNEWHTGFNWGNVLGLDHQLSYQYTKSFTGRFYGHTLSYSVPLPWRDTVTIFGSYDQALPAIGSDFNEAGISGQASLRYTLPLPAPAWLKHDVQFGYDFKTTNTNLQFGGVAVFQSVAEIDQFPLSYQASVTDPYGRTGIENDLVISPGNLSHENNNVAFAAVEAGSTADYIYDRIGLSRITYLPWGFSWISRVLAQISNRNLLSTEELAGGGPDSLPGYAPNTALGSQGELIGEELRLPSFSPLHLLVSHPPFKDAAQFGVFWDYANLFQVTEIPDVPNRAHLADVGMSLRYVSTDHFNLRFDLGWQLRRAPGAVRHGPIAYLSITTGF